jgi:hypothetical protein
MSAVRQTAPGSKPVRQRVPLSEADVRRAEDFLLGELLAEPMDSNLVRHNAEARRITGGALNAARRRLGIMSRSAAWDWSLPETPTVAGAAALLRYRQRRRAGVEP